MTRKDYILIAEVLRVERYNALLELKSAESDKELNPAFENGVISGMDTIAVSIADSLGRDNSRFNKEHFLAVVRREKDLMQNRGMSLLMSAKKKG